MTQQHEDRNRRPRVVALSEAHASLSELVGEARKGRSTGITHRGELVAFLVPVSAVEERGSRDFVKNLEAWRRSLQTGGLAEEFEELAFTKRDVRDRSHR